MEGVVEEVVVPVVVEAVVEEVEAPVVVEVVGEVVVPRKANSTNKSVFQ